jgi:hypothetical protein
MKSRSYWVAYFSAAIAFVALLYVSLRVEVETDRQQTAMMIACVEAGGNWVKNFGPTWNCVRSDSSNFQPGE